MTKRAKVVVAMSATLILISGSTLIVALRSPTNPNSLAHSLFPIIEHGKYGYIDISGKVAIKPRFDMAKRFSEGLARVKVGNKWGFINGNGQIVIQPQFELDNDTHDNDPSLDFHEGMAAASFHSGSRWGYIDKTGSMVIADQYAMTSRFAEGLAVVFKQYPVTLSSPFDPPPKTAADGFFIDKTGKVVGRASSGHTFSDELAVVVSENAGQPFPLAGYIDKSGRLRIEAQFSLARSFHDELACVRPTNGNQWGYIDKTGKMVIPLRGLSQENGPGDFYEGLAAMPTSPEQKWGFIDKTGKFVIEPELLVVGRFSDGLAGACSAKTTANAREAGASCGYLTRTGEWAIKDLQPGDVMTDFNEGLALICREGFCGYINKKGQYVWHTTEQVDLRRLIGCTAWNIGDPGYGAEFCRD